MIDFGSTTAKSKTAIRLNHKPEGKEDMKSPFRKSILLFWIFKILDSAHGEVSASDKLENIYETYDEFEPKFLEPIVMTEMWGGKQKNFIYRYPKTTVVSFRAFNTNFKVMMKRKDGVFGERISMSDYHAEETDKNFLQGDTAAPDILSSVCMFDVHILKHPKSSGMISLCDQRIDGIINQKNDGYRIWTTLENVTAENNNKSVGMTTTKVVHRIAKLSKAKDPNAEVLDMRNDGEDDFDDDFMDQVQANFTQLKQNGTRYRAAISDTMDSTVMPRFVELYILVDDELEASYRGDRGRANKKIAGIISLMNSLYKPFNIEFLISHMKYDFSTQSCSGIDRSSASRFVGTYLNCVKEFRRRLSCDEPNGPMRKSDHTMLITGHRFCDTPRNCILGVAKVYAICNWENSVSLSSAPATSPVWEVGMTITHELGHSFGAMHDWDLDMKTRTLLSKQDARPRGGCTCTLPDGSKKRGKTRKCIMSPIVDKQLSWSWSDCSYADIDFSKESNLHQCLYNRLDKYESIETLLQSACGNGRLDPGEQCENQGTACCTDRCVLRTGAECNIGACCSSDCKLKADGTVCSQAVLGSCDEDDVCNGKSYECIVKYKSNGTPCNNTLGDASHCFRGECRTQSDGCVDVLGKGSVANLEMMQNPDGNGMRRNWCKAKPCEYAKLPSSFSREEFLSRVLQTCSTNEDSVCGSLICRESRARHKRETGNGTDLSYIRRDFHRVMSDRFGQEKWLRTLRHSGILEDSSVDKLRQDGEMSLAQRMKLMKTPHQILNWRNHKFLFFPIASSNPGMAPSGASCGEKGNKMCHNGRCLSLEEFRKTIWDPNEYLTVASASEGVKPYTTGADALFWWTLVALVSLGFV